MGSECEIYAGKNNTEDRNIESDSDASSDVSYSESTDNEEQTKKVTGGNIELQNNETESVETSVKEAKETDRMDKVSKELEQLQVKDVKEKK